MTGTPFRTSGLIEETGIVGHGFFGREGGVSSGVFQSLNAGPGSDDEAAHVAENRRRCMQALGLPERALVTLYQVHSPDVVTIKAPFDGPPPKADALVTTTPGLALGILTADCMPWLFVDPAERVIGAAHGCWRGALAGVLEATVTAMIAVGAKPTNIRAALGPCLRQPNFEVGLDLVDAFVGQYPEAAVFFMAGRGADKRQFDLAGFGAWRLRKSGVSLIDDLDACTLGEEASYFSYRGARRACAEDYGRNLAAIALAP